MIIKELYLKNFGKFSDTRIDFTEKISVIYGENEYGKSTIYAFIKAMLFGLERGRGRAAGKSEFSRYEPWENPGYYAGMMRFSCGSRNFRLERQFDKPGQPAELICEDDGEELSVKDGDLEMLLGGMKRASFENAAAIGSLAAKPGQELAAELKNYAANYYETGSSEVDFHGALETLKKRKKEVEQKLKEEKEKQQNQLERLRIQSEVIQSETERLGREYEELENERKETQIQIEEVRREKSQAEKDSGESGRESGAETTRGDSECRNVVKIIRGILISLLGLSGGIVVWKQKLPLFLIVLLSVVLTVVFCMGIGSVIKEILKPTAIQKKKETDSFQKQQTAQQNTRRNTQQTAQQDMQRNVQQTVQKNGETELHLQEKLNQTIGATENIRTAMKEKQIQLHNLREQMEETALPGEKWRRLQKTCRGLELAMEKLQEVSKQVTSDFGEHLNRETSAVLAQITNGKYTRVFVDDALQMSVYCDGRRIPVDRLSRGTGEQVYFALRMAVLDLLYEENVPVIFDDAFVYYDEKRLKSTLKWLSEQPRQVIIFSCQRREKEIFSRKEELE